MSSCPRLQMEKQAKRDQPGREDTKSVTPEAGCPSAVTPSPGNHTHLHLLLRLLPIHCIRGLTGPTSLALECLDLLVEKSSQGVLGVLALPWEVREGEAWGLTCSVLTWSFVCTKDSSCSSAWPGPSFSLTGVGSVAAWASSSATWVNRMVSNSLGNLPSAQSRTLCLGLPPHHWQGRL